MESLLAKDRLSSEQVAITAMVAAVGLGEGHNPIRAIDPSTLRISQECELAVLEIIRASLVHLAPVETKSDGLYPQLGGSGTLVSIAGCEAVLTARHVAEALGKSDRFALTGIRVGERDMCFFDRKILESAYLSRHSRAASRGPDIALLYLPRNKTGILKAAGKVFYNLDKRKVKVSSLSSPPRSGAWLLSGFPAIHTKRHELLSHTEIDLRSNLYVSFRARYRKVGRYDYYDVDAGDTGEAHYQSDFRGLSGGSLWHLNFSAGTEKEPFCKEIRDDLILWGVPFYQSRIVGGTRFVRCHGHLSLYDALYRL